VYTLNSYKISYHMIIYMNLMYTHRHLVKFTTKTLHRLSILDCNNKQNHVLVVLDHLPVYRVTVPYAACIQLHPPDDEHLRLETCRGKIIFYE